MIDQEAFAEANPYRAVSLSTTLPDSTTEKGPKFTDEYALIAPGRLPGFALQEKIWAYFQVSKMMEINWFPDAYQSLQIKQRDKSILLNLVKAHQITSTSESNDFIPGKGNGLIFLLHGSPGTGKTFTARMLTRPPLLPSVLFLFDMADNKLVEAVAHYTKRPLYATTSGELSKGESLERNLRDALRWSRRWEAIFLLDEADVFLAKRDVGTDMKRNETVTSKYD